jgi:hypothetical protein
MLETNVQEEKVYGVTEENRNIDSEETVYMGNLSDEENKMLEELSNAMGNTFKALEPEHDKLDIIDNKMASLYKSFVSETDFIVKGKLATAFRKIDRKRKRLVSKCMKLENKKYVAKIAFNEFLLKLASENQITLSDKILKHAEEEVSRMKKTVH